MPDETTILPTHLKDELIKLEVLNSHESINIPPMDLNIEDTSNTKLEASCFRAGDSYQWEKMQKKKPIKKPWIPIHKRKRPTFLNIWSYFDDTSLCPASSETNFSNSMCPSLCTFQDSQSKGPVYSHPPKITRFVQPQVNKIYANAIDDRMQEKEDLMFANPWFDDMFYDKLIYVPPETNKMRHKFQSKGEPSKSNYFDQNQANVFERRSSIAPQDHRHERYPNRHVNYSFRCENMNSPKTNLPADGNCLSYPAAFTIVRQKRRSLPNPPSNQEYRNQQRRATEPLPFK